MVGNLHRVLRTFALFFFILPVGAFAQNASTITQEQALQEAVRSNLGLESESLKVGVKKRDKDWSLNRLLPSVSATGILLNQNEPKAIPVAVAGSKLITYTPDASNVGVSVSAQFAFSFAILTAIEQTSIDFDNAQISYAAAKQRLERDVKKLFYQLLVLQETVKLTDRQLKNAEERYNQARTNFQAGLAPELTVLQAQVAWENRKPALEELQTNYTQLLLGFEQLLGRDPDPNLTPVGTLDFESLKSIPDANSLIQKYLDSRADVQAAQGQVRAVQGLSNLQTSLLFPTIAVQYLADPYLNAPFNSNTQWDSANWHQVSGALSFVVSWKLDSFLPFSTFWNQKFDAEDQAAIARIGLTQTKIAAKGEIITLVRKIQKSTDALKSLSQNVDAAKRAYQLTEEAYKSGARSLLEVQDAELQYQASQLILLNEKQLLNSSLLDLEVAVNTPREEIDGNR